MQFILVGKIWQQEHRVSDYNVFNQEVEAGVLSRAGISISISTVLELTHKCVQRTIS